MAFVPAIALRTSARQQPLALQSTSMRAPQMTATPELVSRRAVLAGAGLATVALALDVARPSPAQAADLTVYKDIPKGFSIMRPSGWNEFDGEVEQYDVKWQDVIQPLEFVTVLTSPVAKGKTLSALGDVTTVGERLAKGRGGQVVAAIEMDIAGDTPAYVIEIKKEAAHQITLLTVAKSKLYSLNVSASKQRWPRREKLLRQVVESFQPKL
jgi:PsbP